MSAHTPIPHSRPTLGRTDEEAVRAVLRSGHLTQGEVVAQFEQALASWFHRREGVAVSSGTMALEIAMRALGLGQGDEVIMPSYVCAAPWQACVRVGAIPIVVDIDRATYNIDPAAARRARTSRTKAIVVPHLFGLGAPMDDLTALGIPLIEDCAQTLGAQTSGRLVGSTGLVTVCSFYATKPLCAGEGGMILADDRTLLQRARQLRQYDEAPVLTAGATNAKMTDLHAAIGRAQLSRFPTLLARRREIAAQYRAAWVSLPWMLPSVPDGQTHDYFRFVVRVGRGSSSIDPVSDLLKTFTRQGIHCRRPIFQPLHRALGTPDCPNSEEAAQTALSIPISPALTDDEVKRVIQSVQETCHAVA